MNDARFLADQAFSRAAGAPLVHGNAVRLLRDARGELSRVARGHRGRAQTSIHFESYIIHDDEVGERFAEALIAGRARACRSAWSTTGWAGSGKPARGFWRRLREGGVEVRCFNPPRLDEPLGWLARDHRKCWSWTAASPSSPAFASGKVWEGWPERGLAGWRDTGVEMRGPAVGDVAPRLRGDLGGLRRAAARRGRCPRPVLRRGGRRRAARGGHDLRHRGPLPPRSPRGRARPRARCG